MIALMHFCDRSLSLPAVILLFQEAEEGQAFCVVVYVLARIQSSRPLAGSDRFLKHSQSQHHHYLH